MRNAQVDGSLAVLRGRKQWRPDDARRVLDEVARSGLSMTAFARRHGFNVQRIAWWKKQLAKTNGTTLTLVPLTVKAAPPFACATRVGALTIDIDGVRIEVGDPAQVAPQWLVALIDALQRRTA